MAFIHFYHGRTLAHDFDLSQQIINSNFTIGLNGSVSGWFTIEETSAAVRAQLMSLKENSHAVKFGHTKVYGGFVESAVRNKNIWTVNLVGAFEYLDKVDAVSSHKANIAHGVANSSDYSWLKIFYSDSVTGVLYEVLRNLSDSMEARGYSSSLLDYSSLRSFVTSNTDPNWYRSYRLNSLETPTMRTLIEDIVGDAGMELFRIRVSDDLGNDPFALIFEVVTSATLVELNEASDNVFAITHDTAQAERRSWSVAKGTDWADNSVVERVPFDPDVAYSALVNSAPQERSGAIERFAEVKANAAGASSTVLTFSSFLDAWDPLDYISLASPSMAEVGGMVTEKTVDGITVTYKLQVGAPASFNMSLSKPVDGFRRIIFDPLSRTSDLAARSAGAKDSSTGWRS